MYTIFRFLAGYFAGGGTNNGRASFRRGGPGRSFLEGGLCSPLGELLFPLYF